MPTSVVTVHAQISLGANSKEQWVEHLKPQHWWFESKGLEENGDVGLFRGFRDEFISARLNHITKSSDENLKRMIKPIS